MVSSLRLLVEGFKRGMYACAPEGATNKEDYLSGVVQIREDKGMGRWRRACPAIGCLVTESGNPLYKRFPTRSYLDLASDMMPTGGRLAKGTC